MHLRHVPIPAEFQSWFRKHRTLPIWIELLPDAVAYGGQRLDLRPLPGGWWAVLTGSRVIGEFSVDTVRHLINDKANRDVRVARAGWLDVTYRCPLAYQLEGFELVHPGPCLAARRVVAPRERYKGLVQWWDGDERCVVCGEGFG